MDDLLQVLVAKGLITAPESPKGRLLKAATALFLENGYEKTTVRDLAKVLGIQSGSLFHHFRTKEDILRAVMEEAIHITLAHQELAVSKGQSAKDKLRGLIRSELEVIHGPIKGGMALLVSEWRSLSDRNQRNLLTLRRRYEEFWLGIIQEVGREEQLAFDDPFVLRRLLSGSLNWTIYWFRSEGALTLDELADYCLHMIIKT